MKNIKNLMKVAAVVGDEEKILRDLYEDLGEYLGVAGSNNTTALNPKLSVIGRKFKYATDAEKVLKKLGYKYIGASRFVDLENDIYVYIEFEEGRCVIRENK